MNEEDRPVTRRELKAELADVVETLGARMRDDMSAMEDRLSSQLGEKMTQMHEDLSRELARHVTASAEQTQRLIVGLDDRYRDLPGRVSVLERELDEHRRDTTLHPGRRRR